METYQALYYPFIHFRDDSWVKLSALYWDRLGRIVPAGYETEDSDAVKQLGDVVLPLSTDTFALSFRDQFADFVTEHGAALRKKYAISQRETWQPVPESKRPPKAGGPSGWDTRLAYIHDLKIGPELYEILNSHDLASTDFRGAAWVGMHPRLAQTYMVAMAEELGGRAGMRPITDQTDFHMAASELSMERLARTLLDNGPGGPSPMARPPGDHEVEGTIISVAFQALRPADLETLNVDKILHFREKYPAERAAFQAQVENLRRDVSVLIAGHDLVQLKPLIQDQYQKTWSAQMTGLQEKLHEIGIDTAWACFNVKHTLPGAIAGAAAMLGVTIPPDVAAGIGLTVGAVNVVRDKRKEAQRAVDASPVSYLYRLDKELASHDLWTDMKNWTRSMALGV